MFGLTRVLVQKNRIKIQSTENCEKLKKATASGLKPTTGNGSMMPLTTYLTVCHSWGFSTTPRGWIAKTARRVLSQIVIFCPPRSLKYHLARTFCYRLLRTKHQILWQALLVMHRWTRNRRMVFSVDTWQRCNIGWSMLRSAMLSMMFSRLTRHSKPLMMYS